MVKLAGVAHALELDVVAAFDSAAREGDDHVVEPAVDRRHQGVGRQGGCREALQELRAGNEQFAQRRQGETLPAPPRICR